MRFSLLFVFVIVVGIYSYILCEAREPVCSKFAYEEQLLEKMIRTEIKVETMVNEIKKTEDNVISTLGNIKQTVADFTDMFADMRGNITNEMLKRGDEIKRREESFKTLFEETRKNLTSGNEAEKEKLIQLQGNLEQPAIAFYAHYLNDLLLDTTDEILIFKKTFTNEGTGYDTSTGLFTAPVGGLYQFDVHTYNRKYSYLGLVMEGDVIAADANYGDANHGCNNFGAIIRLKSGAKVWIKSTSSASNRQLYQDSYRFNTFSGLLVNN
ncbi:complement C1q and tumor necrosis factor-related protein 9A-like [Ruditapes philippinarum]|uniref:complement C1q and tumor necrosis factor-related protein 9A-like n=1 Tax=Ruditapes philippinarum TaxID=129788 RepID=UPI00295AE2B6|nr:complement C1q and tumor necrosis factor-related protein 9A-like [Ruditapes philippinarum]